MLYVKQIDGDKIIVSDSENGTEYVVVKILGEYFNFTRLFDMNGVLGYFKGGVYVVPYALVKLLDYIDSISIRRHPVDASVPVCSGVVLGYDTYKVFVMVGGGVCFSILDMLMCASYHPRFGSMLENGCLRFAFNGGTSVVEVKLCGDYLGYVSKLLTVYLGVWEREDKVTGTSFKLLRY